MIKPTFKQNEESIKLPSLKLATIASLLFMACFALLQIFGSSSSFWQGYDQYGLADTQICESIYWDSIIRQPFSSVSNVIFLFFAVLVFCFSYNDSQQESRRNTILANPIFGYLFALNFLLIFLGSSFYHFTLLKISDRADFFGVYAISSLPLLYNILKFVARKLQPTELRLPIAGLLMLAGSQLLFVAICLIMVEDFEFILLTALMLITLTSILFHWIHTERNAFSTLLGAFALAGIAYACFKLDKSWCEPNSWIQGHFWWHLFSAASIFTLYLFFRKEQFKGLTQLSPSD